MRAKRLPQGKRPGSLLKSIEDPATGRTGELRLDKASLAFIGIVEDLFVTGDRAADVVAWVQAELRFGAEVAWQPAIEVRYSAPRTSDDAGNPIAPRFEDDSDTWHGRRVPADRVAKVALTIDRFYLGRTARGTWHILRWEDMEGVPDAERLARAQDFFELQPDDTLPHFRAGEHYGTRQVLLPYDEALWSALRGLVGTLQAAKRQLHELVSSDHGIEALVSSALGGATLGSMLGPGPAAGRPDRSSGS